MTLIPILPGAAFTSTATGADTGLVGTISVEIISTTDPFPVFLAETTSGIAETPADSAIYVFNGNGPTVGGPYNLIWRDGSGHQAIDQLVVSGTISDDYTGAYYTTADRLRTEAGVNDTTLTDDAAVPFLADASDIIDDLLGGYFPDQTTGRKIAEADVDAWRWDTIVRAATKVAAQLYTSPDTFNAQQWKSVSGPDFSFSGPLTSPTPRIVLMLLNRSGLRRMTGRNVGRRAGTTQRDLERAWWGPDEDDDC